jgi:hypothetical protein
MKRNLFAALLAVALAPGVAQAEASRFDRSLKHLDPLTRLEQICAIETMARVNRDDNPYRPDRAVIYALSKPTVKGNTIAGNGGAFRSKGKWYQYSFVCQTTPDHMQVSGFTYRIGKEIPESMWESYGLYR